jgi:hypothetical protein
MITLNDLKTWNSLPASGKEIGEIFSLPQAQGFPPNLFPAQDWSWVWPNSKDALGLQYLPLANELLPLHIRAPYSLAKKGGQRSSDLDPLVKAIWGKKYSRQHLAPLIVDGTAGLLGDAFKLSLHCEKLVAFEQNYFLQILIQHYIQYVQPLAQTRISFTGQSFNLQNLAKISPQDSWILYLDPMFESKDKSLASGPLQLLKLLTDYDEKYNWAQLWEEKVKQAPNLEKIVVKRWHKAPFLFPQAPTYQMETKLVRYDVYQF